jgi:CIC family chloride channel protein
LNRKASLYRSAAFTAIRIPLFGGISGTGMALKRYISGIHPFFRQVGRNEHTILAILAACVGMTAGICAVGFRHLIVFIQTLAYGDGSELLGVLQHLPWYRIVWVPALGGLIVGPVVYFFAREAKGHGVPEVMEAVALRAGVIRKRVVVIKSLVSAVCIATGGSVGREGPIVQIGSAIGSSIGQFLKVSPNRMRTLVGCGAAAGIAATFNAPIAGSMFALEIVLGDFGLATFSPIVISSVVATAASRYFLGDFPAFIVPAYELVSAWELPLYVLLGLFCALVGVAFTKTLYRIEDFFDALQFPEYLKAALGGLFMGLAALVFPHVLGVGYGAIDLTLVNKLAWWLMAILVICKIVATSVTIGSGGSGGIFAPSLFVGAMAGGFFGSGANYLFPEISASAGAYSLVGMGAVVAATTHGPMSAILILFELTGDYKIILPLMMACIVGSVLSGQLLTESIYTLKLVRKGLDLRAGKEVNILKSIHVKDVMNPTVETMPESLPIREMVPRIIKSKFNSFPVVTADNRLCGILSFNDYSDALFDEHLMDLVVAKDLATSEVVTVSLEDNLFTAMEKISVRDFSLLPVVSAEDSNRLEGILTRRDMIGAYNKAVIKKSLLNR